MTEDDIRESFLRFFEGKGHLRIPSSSLIPAGDPTLLLTSAGMVQFKPYFTGEMTPPHGRLTSCQKCFRATDIDSVGDSTHLTFFEMLGNFSVGDYFKQEAIEYAWEFVTGPLGLAQERLWVTVYRDDDEAHDCWVKTGVPPERIRRFGEDSNFWGPAGSEGPCGPCSELHYDWGEEYGCRQPDCGPNCENVATSTGQKPALSAAERCDRFVELWNLVFMQHYQAQDGSRTPLPAPNIDTGMGLERAAAIMQGKRTVYETDVFVPIVQRVAELCGRQYGKDKDADYAMRVVAEHTRAAAFLISDGVVPGNEGRGYVLRRVIRRAIRYGKKLGLEAIERSARGEPRVYPERSRREPYERSERPAHPELVEGRAVLPQVAEVVIERMKGQYPDLEERREFILRVMALEEERFGATLDKGLSMLDGIVVTFQGLDIQVSPIRDLIQSARTLQQSATQLTDPQEIVDYERNIHSSLHEALQLVGQLAVGPGYHHRPDAIVQFFNSRLTDFLTPEFQEASRLQDALNGGFRDAVEPAFTFISRVEEKIIRYIKMVPGEEAFNLAATYGFPPELTEEIAKEKGLEGIDWEGFHEEMRKHAETSRAAAGKFGGDFDAVRAYQDLGVGVTRFLGYETLTASSVVVGLLIDGQQASQAAEGQEVEVVLRETPFYAEMGGQMGDAGEIAGQGSTLHVDDTQAPIAGLTVHRCTVVSGRISLGDTVQATVDPQRRQDTARNHTATHMLHAALRRVLGTHVRQHGSLVAPDRLRFDFTHVSPLSQEELGEVQRLVNDKIRENVPVDSQETTYRQAVAQGALAFFGDKYGDRVRMVAVGQGSVRGEPTPPVRGEHVEPRAETHPSTSSEPALSLPKGRTGSPQPFSLEVCGGTHVHRTGDIGICLVLSESSIGSGLRRIEAVTGRGAEALMSERSSSLEDAARRLQASPDQLVTRVDSLLAELEQARKRAEALERELLKHQVRELPRKQIAGITVVSGVLSVSAAELLREAGDWLRNDVKSGVVILGTVLEGRPTMLIMATADVVAQGFHAGNAVREASRAMGGGGGGRPEMGQAGGRDPGKLKDALQAAEEEVRRWREKP